MKPTVIFLGDLNVPLAHTGTNSSFCSLKHCYTTSATLCRDPDHTGRGVGMIRMRTCKTVNGRYAGVVMSRRAPKLDLNGHFGRSVVDRDIV
jgi:hypothetical protein